MKFQYILKEHYTDTAGYTDHFRIDPFIRI